MAAKHTETGTGSVREPSFIVAYVLGDLPSLERAKRKDKAWGHAVCKESRAAHLRALRDDVSREDVYMVAAAMATLLPSLEKLVATVPEALRYLKNVSWRVRSLMSLSKGGDPSAPEDATPEEVKLIAMYVKAKKKDQRLRELLGAHTNV